MPTLILERFAYAPDGTFGRLNLPSGEKLFTVERPWLGNRTGESCIPDGVYTLALRRSGVVERSSSGRYRHGWEVTDVPGRTYIMLHPANWPDQLEGCIAPGLDYRVLDGRNGVTQSRVAFAKLMTELSARDEWQIDIRPFLMEYP